MINMAQVFTKANSSLTFGSPPHTDSNRHSSDREIPTRLPIIETQSVKSDEKEEKKKSESLKE